MAKPVLFELSTLVADDPEANELIVTTARGVALHLPIQLRGVYRTAIGAPNRLIAEYELTRYTVTKEVPE